MFDTDYDEKLKTQCDRSRAQSALDLCGRFGQHFPPSSWTLFSRSNDLKICILHGHILIILRLVTTSGTKIYSLK